MYFHRKKYAANRDTQFICWCWSECDVTSGTLAVAAIVRIVCWQSEAGCAESKSDQMCEIRLTKLPYVAQQVDIVHFYAVAEIKGLSCRLRWMDEWRNLLTSTHVGHRHVVMWAAASDESLKFGVQGATATNWFSRVNGVRDNGIWL